MWNNQEIGFYFFLRGFISCVLWPDCVYTNIQTLNTDDHHHHHHTIERKYFHKYTDMEGECFELMFCIHLQFQYIVSLGFWTFNYIMVNKTRTSCFYTRQKKISFRKRKKNQIRNPILRQIKIYPFCPDGDLSYRIFWYVFIRETEKETTIEMEKKHACLSIMSLSL